MWLDRRGFFGSAAAVTAGIAVPGVAAARRTPARGKAAEAQALVRFAETTHPRGLEAKADPKWRALAAQLVAAGTRPDAEFIVRAYELLAWFKDAHTTLWAGALQSGPFALQLPVRASVFFDGLYVTEAMDSALLGSRITHVGNLTTEALVRRFGAIWPAGNIAWPHHDAGLLLATPGFLHGLGAVSGPPSAPVPITAAAASGGTSRQLLQPGPKFDRARLQRTQSPRENWAREAGTPNFIRPLPGQRSLYVSLEDISLSPDKFVPFVQQLFAAMDQPQWSKLIIDLRRNPGGNNFLIEPVRKQIARSRFNRPGGLYVLIGPTTFSAAQNLVNRLERETFAIFAGEPTGGEPRHYGDAKAFEFPGGILRGGVSTIPWFDSYPQDGRHWVMPDMLIPRLYADWASGQDRVLDAVLAHSTTAAPDELNLDRIMYWRRESQSAEWKPFWLT